MGATGGDPVPMTPHQRAIDTGMDNSTGSVPPKDTTTVLTRVLNTSLTALQVTSIGPGGSGGIYAPRRAYIRVPATGTIAVGANSDFTITQDINDNAIPNTIYVPQIVIVPSVATIFQLRLFAKSSRALNDPLWYDHAFRAFDEAYANDATGFWFYNLVNSNTIYGNVEIDAGGASAAYFEVHVLFHEGG